MTGQRTQSNHAGLEGLAQRPLLTSLFQRRTHRVSRGSSIEAGSMSYTSTAEREPLTELEEAMLIAVTGSTGLTMPDRPFADPRDHTPVMAKPNLTMAGRTAGSPDNAQGTHFFVDPKEELVGVLMVQTANGEIQRDFEDLVAQSVAD